MASFIDFSEAGPFDVTRVRCPGQGVNEQGRGACVKHRATGIARTSIDPTRIFPTNRLEAATEIMRELAGQPVPDREAIDSVSGRVLCECGATWIHTAPLVNGNTVQRLFECTSCGHEAAEWADMDSIAEQLGDLADLSPEMVKNVANDVLASVTIRFHAGYFELDGTGHAASEQWLAGALVQVAKSLAEGD